MNKSDIIAAIADLNPNLKHKQVKLLTDKLFITLSQALANGQRIEIRGFGSFSLKARKAGLVRNPRHGIAIQSEARHVVYFRAGKELAKRVDFKNN